MIMSTISRVVGWVAFPLPRRFLADYAAPVVSSAWFAFLLPCYNTFKALSHRPLSEPELERLAMFWCVPAPLQCMTLLKSIQVCCRCAHGSRDDRRMAV